MKKAFFTAIIALAIIIISSVYEQVYLKNSFEEFREVTNEVYKKTEEQTAVKSDILAVQNLWIQKKKTLHVFIPHNDIKEVDLWISEAVTLIEKKMWEDALSKLEVVIEISEQIPKTYTLKIENIL